MKISKAIGLRFGYLVASLLLLLAVTACGRGNVHAAGTPTAPEVSIAPVIQQDVPVFSEWVATMDGYVNAQIRPQVSGYIIKQIQRRFARP